MPESFKLPTKPEDMATALVERFNSGKLSELGGTSEAGRFTADSQLAPSGRSDRHRTVSTGT